MRTKVPEKIKKIIAEIDTNREANVTRLTVLKKWLEYPGRMTALALWIGAGVASQKEEIEEEEDDDTEKTEKLLKRAKTLMKKLKPDSPKTVREQAERLYQKLSDFQDEYERQRWALVRIVHNTKLLTVEKALAIYLGYHSAPYYGYELAVRYCQHDGHGYDVLRDSSRDRLQELIAFMNDLEAHEDEGK
jgi:hypothetical protein